MRKLLCLLALLTLVLVWSPAGAAAAPGYFGVPQGGRAPVLHRVYDQFLTDAGAPLASPRTCEPGPGGPATINDAQNLFSIAGGRLVKGTGAARAKITFGSYPRTPGLIFLGSYIKPTGSARSMDYSGWYNASSGTISAYELAINQSSASRWLGVGWSATVGPVITTALTDDVEYNFALPLGSVGGQVFVKGGTEYPNWTLLYVVKTGSADPVYPGYQAYNTDVGSYGFVDVPWVRWLAAPAAYATFDDAFAVTEGYAGDGGLGAGGGGLTWTTQLGTIVSSGGSIHATALGGTGSDRAIATVPVTSAYNLIYATLTKGTTGCGLVTHYTDADNYHYCWHNGTNLITVERLAGVETTKITAAAAYSAGAWANLVATNSSTQRAYYNQTQLVGTASTFNTGLLAPNVGVIFFDTDSTIGQFEAYERGNEGQYDAYLGRFFQ